MNKKKPEYKNEKTLKKPSCCPAILSVESWLAHENHNKAKYMLLYTSRGISENND